MVARLTPDFEAAFDAMDRVARLLNKVTKALDRAGIPYAVLGDNAVAAWISTVDPEATRASRDIELLTDRSHLAEMEAAVRKIGLDMVEVLGVTMFVDRKHPSPKSGVHILFANERVRPEYEHPTPQLADSIRAKSGFVVVDLPALVAMKLQSFRLKDQTHLIDLKSVGLITPDVIAQLPADLRDRLKRIPEPDDH